MGEKNKGKAVEIVFVLDRSGSMAQIKGDAIGGFNQFLQDQRDEPGECLLSLLLFDHEHTVVCTGTPVGELPYMTAKSFVPRGTTALLDAIARGVAVLRERMSAASEGTKALLVIMTDGHENSSREIDLAGVKGLLAGCDDEGWPVIYLGATVDAFDVGVNLGVSAATTSGFAGQSIIGTYSVISQKVSTYRSTGDAASLSFNAEDRDAMS